MLARLARRTRRTVRLLSDDATPAVPHARHDHATRAWRDQEQSNGGGSGGKRRQWQGGKGGALLTCRRLGVSLHPAVLAQRGSSASRASPLLLSKVELEVYPSSAVLVRGNAGVGKTALLRTVCGLWPMGRARDVLTELEPDRRCGLSVEDCQKLLDELRRRDSGMRGRSTRNFN